VSIYLISSVHLPIIPYLHDTCSIRPNSYTFLNDDLSVDWLQLRQYILNRKSFESPPWHIKWTTSKGGSGGTLVHQYDTQITVFPLIVNPVFELSRRIVGSLNRHFKKQNSIHLFSCHIPSRAATRPSLLAASINAPSCSIVRSYPGESFNIVCIQSNGNAPIFVSMPSINWVERCQRSVFEPNKEKYDGMHTFQYTRICSACCCCMDNSGGVSITIVAVKAVRTWSKTNSQRHEHTQSRQVSLSYTRVSQICLFQQIERKLRILYENIVIDPYRQHLERRASISRPNSLDEVVENPDRLR